MSIKEKEININTSVNYKKLDVIKKKLELLKDFEKNKNSTYISESLFLHKNEVFIILFIGVIFTFIMLFATKSFNYIDNNNIIFDTKLQILYFIMITLLSIPLLLLFMHEYFSYKKNIILKNEKLSFKEKFEKIKELITKINKHKSFINKIFKNPEDVVIFSLIENNSKLDNIGIFVNHKAIYHETNCYDNNLNKINEDVFVKTTEENLKNDYKFILNLLQKESENL